MDGPSKIAWIFSVTLHAGLVLLMVFGPSLRPTPRPQLPTGVIMEAVVIDAKTLNLANISTPQPDMKTLIDQRREIDRREQARIDKEDEQARIAQQKREQQQQEERLAKEREAQIVEEQRLQKLEQDRLAVQKEKERLDKLAREAALEKQQAEKLQAEKDKALAQQTALEEKKRQERLAEEKQAAEAKAAAERKKQELAKKEAAARKKAAEAKARKAALEAQMKAEMDAREAELQAALGVEEKRNTAVNSGLLAQYQAEIIAKVTRNWNRPPSADDGLVCKVHARQIPGGEVVSVKVLECNGDDAVERSIESAVRKSSPLPEPPDPTLFEREIIFTFAPK